MNHDNLINFDKEQPAIVKINRQSKEYRENPMFIEFELNNDEDEEQINNAQYRDNKLKSPTHKIFEVPNVTNQSYNYLELSRKEERRLFSPPFKLPKEAL